VITVSAPVLPVAELCGEAAPLLSELGPSRLRAQLRRDAMITGMIQGEHFHSAPVGLYEASLRALTEEDRVLVAEGLGDYFEAVSGGAIPEGHYIDQPLGMDVVNSIPIRSTDPEMHGIHGFADNCWVSRDGDDAIAVVLQHRFADEPPIDVNADLELAFYGVAWALSNEVDKTLIGYCEHWPKTPPRLIWSSSTDIDIRWDRVRRAARRPRIPAVGPHCERCPARRGCRTWLAPALLSAHEALKPFVKRGAPLNDDRARDALRVIGSMRDMITIVEGQLRSYANDNGGIVVGKRVWRKIVTAEGKERYGWTKAA
jgi:hypothetical protein